MLLQDSQGRSPNLSKNLYTYQQRTGIVREFFDATVVLFKNARSVWLEKKVQISVMKHNTHVKHHVVITLYITRIYIYIYYI